MDISMRVVNRKPELIYGVTSVEGRITIGNFKETFVMPIEYWDVEYYQKQWQEGLERIKTHNQSCLIASIYDPQKRLFINRWVLYKEGNTIFIQNNLLVDEIYEEIIGNNPFTKETCYTYIQPRRTITEEGFQISEWSINLDGTATKSSEVYT